MKEHEDLLEAAMCTVLHDLVCSSTYRHYLNGGSQISYFTSDLLPAVQYHISGCHTNIYYSCPILEFKKFYYFLPLQQT